MIDNEIIQFVVANTSLNELEVQTVLSAVEKSGTHTIVKTDPTPRKLRCKQCKKLKPSNEINSNKVCTQCADSPAPDDRDKTVSIRTVSAGLPTLGKR